jgi:hypothetical protein
MIDYNTRLLLLTSAFESHSLAKCLKQLRILLPQLCLSELKESIRNRSPLEVPSFSTSNVDIFFAQLADVSCYLCMEQDPSLPVNLVDAKSKRVITREEIQRTVDFYASFLFRRRPESIAKYVRRILSSEWTSPDQGKKPSGNVAFVDSPPTSYRKLSNRIFSITDRVRCRLDDMGCHPDTLSYLYRRIGVDVEPVAWRKLSALSIPIECGFALYVASMIKLAVAQLMYEEDGPLEAVSWCSWLCSGFVPCDWAGTVEDGKLVLLCPNMEIQPCVS